MFSSLLIANRGEIAVRVIRTARRLGLHTIAVYSEADRDALHVRQADTAIEIGPAGARESYLNVDRIVQAAQRTGAQAIHPGYGFLSESAHFAQACDRAGIAFVGPPAHAIRAMGSKSAAKNLLGASGVPLTPGYHGENQETTLLASEAGRIGYPVMIKASAGGGGKGMRRVDRPEDFAQALAACQREAFAAFGSQDVLLEKFIVQPRHIEIQVFADTHGHVVHLFERDCSVQRRHQKVVEEAPAPGMTPALRAAMGNAAVAVARAVGYVGAGTVEFIVPGAQALGASPGGPQFFFMEMNTRLQVEHPVTECITGHDLVEWQLRVAAGEPLPCTQEQLSIRGHALEARVYAEDPDQGFLPCVGTLAHLRTPPASAHVRWDAGVEAGDTVGASYDPMIGKLITWDLDRDRARRRMREALSAMHIVGVASNVEFLTRLIDAPSFSAAQLDTGLIERDAASLAPHADPPATECWLLAGLAHLQAQRADLADPWARADSWRLNAVAARPLRLAWHAPARQDERALRVTVRGADRLLELDGKAYSCRVQSAEAGPAGGLLRVAVNAGFGGHAMVGDVVRHQGAWHVFYSGRHAVFTVRDALDDAGGAGAHIDAEENEVRAPMPGRVATLLVAAGTRVARGTPLLVVEAMKMEHTVRAPRNGVLASFAVKPGDQVKLGERLAEFAGDTQAPS